MARFSGMIGFGHTKKEHGITELVITERKLNGDIHDVSVNRDNGESVVGNLRPMHNVSVVIDSYVLENIPAIRYVTWMGTRWVPSNIKVSHPRLIIRLGEVYSGPTP